MTYLDEVGVALAHIRAADRYRTLATGEAAHAADFSTNDYLGLAADPRMAEALRHFERVGSGGARLLGGGHREHVLLENDIARWLGREKALIFSSGYMAALGVIPVLARFAETVYSDALNHASLIDGIRAAKRPRTIYPHGRLPKAAQRSRPALIVTESLFGMDGDCVNPREILDDLRAEDMLLVDEAHALGVFGPDGSGLAFGLNDPRVVILGTLGKAIGAAGGFVAGPAPLIDLLVNQSRTFIFDTASPPVIAFAARIGIVLACGAGDRRARLFQKIDRLRAGLQEARLPIPSFASPVTPIVLGSEMRAVDAMRICARFGVKAPAIRPPTVPPGTSRLRISLRSDHTDEQIDLLLQCLTRIAS